MSALIILLKKTKDPASGSVYDAFRTCQVPLDRLTSPTCLFGSFIMLLLLHSPYRLRLADHCGDPWYTPEIRYCEIPLFNIPCTSGTRFQYMNPAFPGEVYARTPGSLTDTTLLFPSPFYTSSVSHIGFRQTAILVCLHKSLSFVHPQQNKCSFWIIHHHRKFVNVQFELFDKKWRAHLEDRPKNRRSWHHFFQR